MFRILVLVCLVALSGWKIQAEDVNGDGRETILLPFAFFGAQQIPGAFGTLWSGEVWLDNRNNEDIGLFSSCGAPTCPRFPRNVPNRVLYPPLYGESRPELGFLFAIRSDLARNVTFSNRILETTLRAQPRAVDIPVVREGEFFNAEKALLGIPAGSGVRTSLRIYDPWFHYAPAQRPGPPLEAVIIEVEGFGLITLRPALLNPTTAQENWHKPGFVAIHDLAAQFPGILDQAYVHIRVRPVPADAQYWGMVAVTDNETQTVTIVTAQ